MGAPIQAGPNPISNWTEDDLTQFIQRHLDKLPPQTLTPFLHASKLHVGTKGMTVEGRIHHRMMDAPTLISSSSGPGYQNGCSDSTTPNMAAPQFYRDPFMWVHFYGTVSCPSAQLGNPMFTLPPEHRPDHQLTIGVPVFDTVAGNWMSPPVRPLIITNGGAVYLGGTSSANPVDIHLAGVKFPITAGG